MCVQPIFIIGTYDKNGNPDFAPITWLNVTHDGEQFLIVISMYGTKKTKMNVKENGQLSANLVSTYMLPLVDYFGSISGKAVKAPTLDMRRWVYELEVEKTVTLTFRMERI